jgi:L-alanine-DL-glutamate epimerase-like enolase superfamily enzyme
MLTKLDAPIEQINAFTVRIPLQNPLRVFGSLITEREFAFVEVHSNGKVGRGYGLSRNMPITPLIERHIAPFLQDQPAGAIRAIWNKVRQSANMIGEHGVFARALALVDIALWDLHGLLLNEPLWRLLGGAQNNIPLIAIAGYYQDNAVETLRQQIETLLNAGYRTFKIPFGLDVDLDQQRLTAFREVAGMDVKLALDASAAYNNLKAAHAALNAVEPYQIAFLEDPFPASHWELAVQLAQQTHIPIAFGESVSDIATMQRLGSSTGIDISPRRNASDGHHRLHAGDWLGT